MPWLVSSHRSMLAPETAGSDVREPRSSIESGAGRGVMYEELLSVLIAPLAPTAIIHSGLGSVSSPAMSVHWGDVWEGRREGRRGTVASEGEAADE